MEEQQQKEMAVGKYSTKNKREPTLSERIPDFSTPSKIHPKKKLKLVMESEEKKPDSEVKPLKPIEIFDEEQFAYKGLNDGLANFFIQNDDPEVSQQLESTSKKMPQKESPEPVVTARRAQGILRKFGKIARSYDF